MDNLWELFLADLDRMNRNLWEHAINSLPIIREYVDEEGYKEIEEELKLIGNNGFWAMDYLVRRVRGTPWAMENCPEGLSHDENVECRICGFSR